MTERLPHYVRLFVALLIGFWVATSAPATAQFDQMTRALGLTGQVLSPLSLLYDSAATLIAMAPAYAIPRAIFARLGIENRSD